MAENPNATGPTALTPGQILGELIRAGQYFLDRSGETANFTMRDVVEGIQNQYLPDHICLINSFFANLLFSQLQFVGNPMGLVDKTREIVELLRKKVLEKQNQQRLAVDSPQR